MNTSVNQESGIKKQCRDGGFGLACFRYLGVGCEICAISAVVIAGALVLIWGLMYVLN